MAEAAEARITVPAPTGPTAQDDHGVLTGRAIAKGLKLALTANDEAGTFKLDKNALTIIDGPDHGTVQVKGGKAVYKPDAGFSGDDFFTYTIADKYGTVSNEAGVHIAAGGPIAQASRLSLDDLVLSAQPAIA
jgi:hypothetical protein